MGRRIAGVVLACASLAALLAGCEHTGASSQATIPEIHDPGPSRTTPMTGAAPDPIRPGPQGTLPNPYVNPR
jgi:hypothetical protein